MVTLAPERDGADEFIAACAELGVTPAIGHTDADAALVTRAIGRIADATGRPAVVTHLFNGMPPLHHRSGGPVAAALAAAARVTPSSNSSPTACTWDPRSRAWSSRRWVLTDHAHLRCHGGDRAG